MTRHFTLHIITRTILFPANDFSSVTREKNGRGTCKTAQPTRGVSGSFKSTMLIFAVDFYTRATTDFSIPTLHSYARIDSKPSAASLSNIRSNDPIPSCQIRSIDPAPLRRRRVRAFYTCLTRACHSHEIRLHLISASSELSRLLKDINCLGNVRASGFDSVHDGSSGTLVDGKKKKNLTKEKNSPLRAMTYYGTIFITYNIFIYKIIL